MEQPSWTSKEVECPGVMATAAEWAAIRASVVDAAERAAFSGYANDRLGRWEISVQRQAMGRWPPGCAAVVVTIVCGHELLRRWRTEIPVMGSAL